MDPMSKGGTRATDGQDKDNQDKGRRKEEPEVSGLERLGFHTRGLADDDERGGWGRDYMLPGGLQGPMAGLTGEHNDQKANSAQWGYHKLASVVEYVEEHAETGNPESVLTTLEAFATGVGQWLKVAGGAKAPLIENAIGGRPILEGELVVEFGTFIGYTSTRLCRQMIDKFGGRAAASPYKLPRLISIEVDPVNAFVARHIIDLARVLCYMEVWTGQIKDVIPRIQEVWGERSLAFGFLDYKGSRYHVDFKRWEQLDLIAPYGRLVADNTVSPGSPLLLWNLQHSTACATTLWAMQEFLEEAIEDWMAVFDYQVPAWGEREKHPSLTAEEVWEDSWANWDGVEWKDEWNEDAEEDTRVWTGDWPEWKGI